MDREDNPLIASRMAKLAALREAGVHPYPNGFSPDQGVAHISLQFGDEQNPELLAAVQVRVAGRILLLRDFGKLTFAHIQDETGKMQLAVQRDEVGAEFYQQVFRKLDVGDIIGVVGHLFRTKTGELTVRAESVRLLTKSQRPLPEKWHGLEDVETRYRQRYLDLMVNPESRQLFRTRSRIIRLIRDFMEKRGFLEVETPMMHPIPGGAAAKPFVTHHNALDMKLYLRIAPELYLKRLVVGGFERVFEINRSFRNEGLSVRHNPEFTMMEFYQAYADYQELMTFTEELFVHVTQEIKGGLQFTYQGKEIDLTPPWPRLNLAQALVQYAAANPQLVNDRLYLNDFAHLHGVTVAAAWDDGKVQLALFDEMVEHRLLQPVFIIDYPISVSPLSRRSDTRPEVAERFELFVAGWEIANAFSELNDPQDQAERFRQQVKEREAGDHEAMYFDADYIRALEYGMPPTAGEGIGIDRLVMLLTDSAAIRDVLLFPHLRPEGVAKPPPVA